MKALFPNPESSPIAPGRILVEESHYTAPASQKEAYLKLSMYLAATQDVGPAMIQAKLLLGLLEFGSPSLPARVSKGWIKAFLHSFPPEVLRSSVASLVEQRLVVQNQESPSMFHVDGNAVRRLLDTLAQ